MIHHKCNQDKTKKSSKNGSNFKKKPKREIIEKLVLNKNSGFSIQYQLVPVSGFHVVLLFITDFKISFEKNTEKEVSKKLLGQIFITLSSGKLLVTGTIILTTFSSLMVSLSGSLHSKTSTIYIYFEHIIMSEHNIIADIYVSELFQSTRMFGL